MAASILRISYISLMYQFFFSIFVWLSILVDIVSEHSSNKNMALINVGEYHQLNIYGIIDLMWDL